MTASIRHVHSPLRATNCALSVTRSMVKASTAAAMQVLFQDFRNSDQTQPSAAIALGAAKGRGYGRMIWLSCFIPPCPPCLAAVGLARFNDPPGTPSLETHGRFSALRHAKAMFGAARCSPPEKSGRTHSHPAVPGHIRRRGRREKRKCITNVAWYNVILKATTSRRVLLKHATK